MCTCVFACVHVYVCACACVHVCACVCMNFSPVRPTGTCQSQATQWRSQAPSPHRPPILAECQGPACTASLSSGSCTPAGQLLWVLLSGGRGRSCECRLRSALSREEGGPGRHVGLGWPDAGQLAGRAHPHAAHRPPGCPRGPDCWEAAKPEGPTPCHAVSAGERLLYLSRVQCSQRANTI